MGDEYIAICLQSSFTSNYALSSNEIMDAKQARIMYEEKKLNLTTGYVLWFF